MTHEANERAEWTPEREQRADYIMSRSHSTTVALVVELEGAKRQNPRKLAQEAVRVLSATRGALDTNNAETIVDSTYHYMRDLEDTIGDGAFHGDEVNYREVTPEMARAILRRARNHIDSILFEEPVETREGYSDWPDPFARAEPEQEKESPESEGGQNDEPKYRSEGPNPAIAEFSEDDSKPQIP